MKPLQIFKYAAVIGTLAFSLGVAQSASAKTLHWASVGDAYSLDPDGLNETFTKGFLYSVYEPLVAYDPEMNLIPALAVKWENPSPTKWIFHLRKGVKFHDGEPFTADDVIFSWKRSLSTHSDLRLYGKMASDVKKLDDHTVEVITPEPNPILPRAWTNLYIMSKGWAEKHHTTEAAGIQGGNNYAVLHEDGTGPFEVTDREPGVKTVMKRFTGYWDKNIPTNLTEIVFRPIAQESTRLAALLSGQMDLVYPIPTQDWKQLERQSSVKLLTKPSTRAIFIGFDQARDQLLYSNVKGKNPFKDKRVREAFNLAVNTNLINKKIMGGSAYPLGTVIAKSINGFDPSFGKPYVSNVAKAKDLMKEAGYADGFEVTLDCTNDHYVNDEKICQAVAAMLAHINVKIDVLAQAKSKFFAKVNLPRDDTSMYLYGWAPATVDAYKSLNDLAVCRNAKTGAGQANLGGYCNPEVDKLASEIATETNQATRNELIKKAFTIVRDDYAYLPLHQQPISWGVRKGIKLAQRPDDVVDMRYAVMP